MQALVQKKNFILPHDDLSRKTDANIKSYPLKYELIPIRTSTDNQLDHKGKHKMQRFLLYGKISLDISPW